MTQHRLLEIAKTGTATASEVKAVIKAYNKAYHLNAQHLCKQGLKEAAFAVYRYNQQHEEDDNQETTDTQAATDPAEG